MTAKAIWTGAEASVARATRHDDRAPLPDTARPGVALTTHQGAAATDPAGRRHGRSGGSKVQAKVAAAAPAPPSIAPPHTRLRSGIVGGVRRAAIF